MNPSDAKFLRGLAVELDLETIAALNAAGLATDPCDRERCEAEARMKNSWARELRRIADATSQPMA